MEPWLPAELLRLLCSPAMPASCCLHPLERKGAFAAKLLRALQQCPLSLCVGSLLALGCPRLVLAQRWVVFGQCI